MSDLDNFEHRDDGDETIQQAVFNVTLHRGNVLNELENFFLAHPSFNPRFDELFITMAGSNDTLEKGEGGGVMRDALSEYWETFALERASMVGHLCHKSLFYA